MKIDNEGKHNCTLPPEEDVLVTFINDGYFVLLRRKIKRYFLIDEHCGHTKENIKSKYSLEREKKNHLKNHYFMIHPFSKARCVIQKKAVFQIILS